MAQPAAQVIGDNFAGCETQLWWKPTVDMRYPRSRSASRQVRRMRKYFSAGSLPAFMVLLPQPPPLPPPMPQRPLYKRNRCYPGGRLAWL